MAYEEYDEESDEQEDYLEKAKEELKRVDHQVYVTLKYTRTVDVLINVQKRMISAYEAIINALLNLNNETADFPKSVIEKTNKVLEEYDDPQVRENITIYLLLRKIVNSKSVIKESEYRRPVKLRTVIDGQEIMIDIDAVSHFYAVLMSFYSYVELLYKNKEV